METYDLTANLTGREEYIKRVGIYVRMRWLLLTILGATGLITAFYNRASALQIRTVITLIVIGLASNLVFSLATYFGRRLKNNFYVAVALLIIIADIAIYSAGVYIGGGSISRAVLLYTLPIVITGGLFSRVYIYLTAGFCVLFYMVTIVLYETRVTGSLPTMAVFLQSGFYAGVLMIVAYLTDYLYAIKHSKAVELAQTELVSLASHQLRTPATAVKGFLSFLLDDELGPLTSRQKEFVRQAYAENEIQLRLIDNILNVSRIELKSLHFEPTVSDLSQLAQEVIEEHSAVIKRRAQTITFRGTTNLKAVFDVQLIRMVLDNLISNASKYCGEGGRIVVAIHSDKTTVKVSVEDNGIGISKADQKQLFKRFTRVGRGQSDKAPGSGLGLYLARELMRLHHGKISLVSYPNEGSIFTITMPRKVKTHGQTVNR